MRSTTITHLFLDIGNVLLTNGWDRPHAAGMRPKNSHWTWKT